MWPRVPQVAQRVQRALTCTGQLGQTERVMDPDTLEYVDTFVPTWTGRCLVYPRGMDPRQVSAGEATWTVTRYDVTLPADAPVVVGDQFKVTISPLAPEVTGVDFTIIDAPVNAWSVARQCVAATSTT